MNTKLNHVQDWIQLAKQTNWSVQKMAGNCHVSVRTVERYFLENKGKTPKVWLIEQRQKTAIELLRKGYSVKETAGLLGYKHPNQLSRDFIMFWGHSPRMLAFKPDSSDPHIAVSQIAL